MPTVYRIHPTIGIARVGTSRTDSFDGPEVPDIHFLPPGGNFRDTTGAIRRQGVKFYVYAFTYADAGLTQLKDVRRLNANDAQIEWTVHLANTKSFTSTGRVTTPVPNDPGAKSIKGGDPAVQVIGRIFATDVQLGTLETPDAATLRVLGGFGECGPPGTPQGGGLHWPGWYDDVADGPVRAKIKLTADGSTPPVESAWLVTGVPKFATPMTPIVTMYEAAYDIAVRHFGYPRPTSISFTRDIYPMLERAVLFQFVEGASRTGHGPGRPGEFLKPALLALLADSDPDPASPAGMARARVLEKLKDPSGGGGDMPRLIGPPSAETPKASGLTLTLTQYETFRRWSIGDFTEDWVGVPPVVPLDMLPMKDQPDALNRASLDTGVGGTYGPGIEVGVRFGERTTFTSGLRVLPAHPPGLLTSTLSIPWPVDYSACGTSWWPAARPNRVMKADHTFDNWARFAGGDTMLKSWMKLAFIKRDTHAGGTVYLETERL